jgi:hypothetical protein
MRSSEDDAISPQNHNDSDKEDDTADTDNTQWTDSTHCQPFVPADHMTIGAHSGLQQNEAVPGHIGQTTVHTA